MVQKRSAKKARTGVMQRRPIKAALNPHTPARAKHVVRINRSWTRRLFMHPTATFGLLVVGVLLVSLSLRAAAVDYSVNAVVEADPLMIGAVITNPNDEAVFTMKPTTVSGTCPSDSYVKLTRNGVFSGVAICGTGAFSIQTDLFDGLNTLQAQAYNITDQPGPVTPSITVTYNPPATASPNTTRPPLGTAPSPARYTPPASNVMIPEDEMAKLPFLLSTDYEFTVAATFDLFELQLQYRTGVLPIATHVEWGDEQKSDMVVRSHDMFKAGHKYTESGAYIITITGTDAKARTTTMQLVAYIRNSGDPVINGNILPPPSGSSTPQAGKTFQWLRYAWPTYGVITIMVLSFWLGERREFLKLIKAARYPRRPRHP